MHASPEIVHQYVRGMLNKSFCSKGRFQNAKNPVPEDACWIVVHLSRTRLVAQTIQSILWRKPSGATRAGHVPSGPRLITWAMMSHAHNNKLGRQSDHSYKGLEQATWPNRRYYPTRLTPLWSCLLNIVNAPCTFEYFRKKWPPMAGSMYPMFRVACGRPPRSTYLAKLKQGVLRSLTCSCLVREPPIVANLFPGWYVPELD
jgi:hypothetical protein